MTVCALGFYFLSYPENVRRWQFRMLVLFCVVSIAQDVFCFMLNRDVDDDEEDGGVERSVKSFSRKISYISFAWRFIVALILWKCSLNFFVLVREPTLRHRVKFIIKKHRGELNSMEEDNDLKINPHSYKYA